MSKPNKIVVKNLNKIYTTAKGPFTALSDINLEVKDGEFLAIVGPSGCGKSTLLRIIAGLEPITDGTVTVQPGADRTKPLNNVVFQEYALFPWKTVRDNVAFGLQMRGIKKEERYSIAKNWLERVGLSKFADHYPDQISGGMKQRVSIARALANDPDVLLMDEPLGALDAQTRTILQEELIQLWEANRKTVIYITHSLDEAVLMGDRVVLMTAHPGKLKEIHEITLPRPRTLETRTTSEFTSLTQEIWSSLRVEVERTMEDQR